MEKELSPIDGGSVFERNTLNTVFLFPPSRSTVPSSITSDSPPSILYSLSMSDNPKSFMDSSVPSMMNKGFVDPCELSQDMEITTDPNTRNESNGDATEIEEDLIASDAEENLHFFVSSEVQFITNELHVSETLEDSFDGNLDSIQPPWVEDPKLNWFLEKDTESEMPLQIENYTEVKLMETAIEESHSQSVQESETETSISPEETEEPEKLPNSPLKLTKSASCDDLIKSKDAKEIITKLQEVLCNPSESSENKVFQGQKLVRSLSDLLLVSTKGENNEAPSKVPAQSQRSKSFTGLKKSYAIPEKTVNLSMTTKIPNIKLHNADFAGKLKIKKNDHEPRRGPMKAIPLENLRNIKKTPEDRDGVIKTDTPKNAPCASSTPVFTGASRKTQRSPTTKRKSYSDGPMDLQKVKLSVKAVPQRGPSLGSRGIRSSMSKINENMRKLPEYKDFSTKSLNKGTNVMITPTKAGYTGDVMKLRSNKENLEK